MFVWVCACSCISVLGCVEARCWCLVPLLLFTLYINSGSLSEPGAPWFSWPVSSWALPVSAAWCWASRHMPHLASVFLMSEWQFFCKLSHLPSFLKIDFYEFCVFHILLYFFIIMVADIFHNKYFYIQLCCIFISRGLPLCTEEFSLYVSSPQLSQHTDSYSLNIKLWLCTFLLYYKIFLKSQIFVFLFIHKVRLSCRALVGCGADRHAERQGLHLWL